MRVLRVPATCPRPLFLCCREDITLDHRIIKLEESSGVLWIYLLILGHQWSVGLAQQSSSYCLLFQPSPEYSSELVKSIWTGNYLQTLA